MDDSVSRPAGGDNVDPMPIPRRPTPHEIIEAMTRPMVLELSEIEQARDLAVVISPPG